jgi:ribosomal protein L36
MVARIRGKKRESDLQETGDVICSKGGEIRRRGVVRIFNFIEENFGRKQVC